jgi:predicted amidohydrolase
VRRALALLGAAAALAPAPAGAKTVRVFAVGPKFNLSWVDTRAHFHDHLLGLVDKKQRKDAGVQKQADDVASHLLKGERNLVSFPEDLGLMAIFTGSQGRQARGASDVTTAIIDVLGAYAPQTAYYAAKYPALTQRPLPTRLLAVAATDTFARVAVETYAEIAAKYHVWLEGGIDMAQDWHVVCNSKATMPKLPGGVTCDEENPGKVAQLRSPDEPNRTYAYEATTDKASNMALVFDPTGKLVSKQVKTYLTPIELQSQLDLLPGEVFTGLSALKTPVGTLGFVTSKDAWMPDVVERLDSEHVDLLVQPEFFVGDTISTKGPWEPDNIQGAMYSDVLRAPSIEAGVLPSLTGNLFDLSADQQQAVAVKPRGRRTPRGYLVGQPPAPGYAKVGAYVAKDRPKDSIAARRKRMGQIGEKLTPDAKNPACPSPAARGACRGGQVEDVIHYDVQVDRHPKLHRQQRRKRGATPFGVDRPIAASSQPQRNVALAASGPKLVVAAFEQADKVLVVRSPDGGRTWGRPQTLSHGVARWPAVAIGAGGTVWVAWTQDDRVVYARSTDEGATFSPAVPVDATVNQGVQQLRPAIAAIGSDAYVAWVDDRDRFTGDDLPQAGIYGIGIGSDFVNASGATRLDSTAAPADDAKTLDNAWAPALASDGQNLELTWIDFRSYQWDAFARESTDGGATWAAERRVNDTPASDEALEDTPRPAFAGGKPLIAYTDWAKSADSATKPSPLYDIDVDGRKVDGTGSAHVDAFAPSIAAAGAKAYVAWEDHRHGDGDVYATRVGGRPVRVDDSGNAGWNQWRPALAISNPAHPELLVAWEDERDGPSQILFARAPVRRIG